MSRDWDSPQDCAELPCWRNQVRLHRMHHEKDEPGVADDYGTPGNEVAIIYIIVRGCMWNG
jgi:hypothetical protein